MKFILSLLLSLIIIPACTESLNDFTSKNVDKVIVDIGQPKYSKEYWMEGFDSVYNFYFEYYDLEDKSRKRFDSIEFNQSNEKLLTRLLKESKMRKLYHLGFLYKMEYDSIYIYGLDAKFEIDSITLKTVGFDLSDKRNIGMKIRLPAYDLDTTITRLLLKRIANLKYQKLFIFTEKKFEHIFDLSD